MVIWNVNEKIDVYMLLVCTASWEVIWQGFKHLKMCTCFDPAISGVWLGMHVKILLISIYIYIAAYVILAKYWGN